MFNPPMEVGGDALLKRWLLQYGQRYSALNVTVLADDFYCHQPLCQQVLAEKMNVITGLSSQSRIRPSMSIWRALLPYPQDLF